MDLKQALFLLDTNIILYLLGGRLVNPLSSGNYFISVITEMELLSYPSLKPEEEKMIRNLINQITVVEIKNNVKELAIRFRKEYKLKLPDAIIVASAKSLNATLLTNDISRSV